MRVRECPYCHKQISFSKCSIYFLRGTAFSIRCNHCNKSISLEKEPIPVKACWVAGFASIVVPMNFCLYHLHTSFRKALACSLPIFLFLLLASMVLTICRIKFKKNDINN